MAIQDNIFVSRLMFLYVKTHNVTGLKYLGQTVQNPHKYTGSGLKWVRHYQKYGKDISTHVIFSTYNKEELKWWARYFSELWDVVDSEEWANLIEETGEEGGVPGHKKGFFGKKHTEEWKRNQRVKMLGRNKGRVQSDEERRMRSAIRLGHKDSVETRLRKSIAAKKAKNKKELVSC
jgi:hypothetical protein